MTKKFYYFMRITEVEHLQHRSDLSNVLCYKTKTPENSGQSCKLEFPKPTQELSRAVHFDSNREHRACFFYFMNLPRWGKAALRCQKGTTQADKQEKTIRVQRRFLQTVRDMKQQNRFPTEQHRLHYRKKQMILLTSIVHGPDNKTSPAIKYGRKEI